MVSSRSCAGGILLSDYGIGKTYDTGSKVGFLAANVAFAMAREDIRPGFMAELKKIVGSI